MALTELTKITGPGIKTDTNLIGNNAHFTGITTTDGSFNVGVTTIHSNLAEVHNIVSTGIVTATKFVGDGSGLTGLNTSLFGWTNIAGGGLYDTDQFKVGIGTESPRFNLEVGAVGMGTTSMLVNGLSLIHI